MKFHQFYLVKFKVSTLTYGKMTRGHFSIINKFFKLKKRLQQPGARRTRVAHHHGSDTPTSPRAVLYHTDANLCTILHTTVDHLTLFIQIGGGGGGGRLCPINYYLLPRPPDSIIYLDTYLCFGHF
jgi:hypothetical protein